MGPVVMSGIGVGISAMYQIEQRNDPVPVIVIGGIWVGAIIGVTAVNEELGKTIAAVFLLGMVLTRGSAVINWVNGAVQGQQNAQTQTQQNKKASKK